MMDLDTQLDMFISGFPEEKRDEALERFCEAFGEVIEQFDNIPSRIALQWFQDGCVEYDHTYESNPATRLLDAFVARYLYMRTLN